MAKVLIFSVCLALIVSRVESCFKTDSIQVNVPQIIQPGYRIPKVELTDCVSKSMSLTLTDPSFTINKDGEIEASASVPVSTGGRTFSVRARGDGGLTSEMEIHLVRSAVQYRGQRNGEVLLRRSKRRWSPPPFNILENDAGPFPRDIEAIESDSAATRKVYYTISGPGYNQYPANVFAFNGKTGMISLLKAVDREEFPSFTLTARVFDVNTQQETDDLLPIHIIVDDVNDNRPTFTGPQLHTVPEQSKAGTVVGKVNATDRDQQGTLHVKIRYSLLTGLDLFAINPNTGVITTVTNTLDRETKDKYLVTVQIKDMDGAVSGLSNTGTATITVGDINDNPPTFTKPSYTATVRENENEKLILRIPVEDKDLINTPNWISKFQITKGNENKNFKIDTDPKTNEGLLYVSKFLDFEKSRNVKLEIMARNEPELSGTSAKWNSIPLDITVIDVDEGPEFTAPTKTIKVKENTPNGTEIGVYTALDPETKSSNGITYYKVSDPAGWISVNRNTGQLKVANTIDRESKNVQNGMYNITMKAVDASSKSGTGTVIIVVEDVNDNKPVVPTRELLICEKEGELRSVEVVAEDKDEGHFSSPFSFTLPPNNDGKWSLKAINDTAVLLKQMKELPRGMYKVDVDVRDAQSNGGIQTVKVRICQCRNGACMPKDSSVSLGALALLAMLLPLALLLLLCILVVFFCVTKKEQVIDEVIGDSGGTLIKSNYEAPGEEVDASLLPIPTKIDDIEQGFKGPGKGSAWVPGWPGSKGTLNPGTKQEIYSGDISKTDIRDYYSGNFGTWQQDYGDNGMNFDSRYHALNSSLLHTWQTNGRHLQQKLAFLGSEEDGRYADDIIHDFRFEGVGSAAGSVGCCSDYGDNNDLEFLNTLGPKFKTLADVCTKT